MLVFSLKKLDKFGHSFLVVYFLHCQRLRSFGRSSLSFKLNLSAYFYQTYIILLLSWTLYDTLQHFYWHFQYSYNTLNRAIWVWNQPLNSKIHQGINPHSIIPENYILNTDISFWFDNHPASVPSSCLSKGLSGTSSLQVPA